MEDCKANILVVEDEKMTETILPHMGELPHLKKIVQWTGNISGLNSDVITWDDVMKIGAEDTNDQPVLERHLNMAINECCLLVYTSGTTGSPKGEIKHLR